MPPFKTNRKAQYPIQSMILNRWSPRAMTGEEMNDEELFPLFEAARWAPSSYNNQHWRFIYAKRDSKEWQTFLNLLVAANQTWANKASVLIVLASSTVFEKNQKPARTHSFDTGAAWQNFALEGSYRGYVVHGMQGFDYEKAKKQLNIPDSFEVEAMIAVGKQAAGETLPEELQKVEKPNDRKPLQELIMEGKFQ